MSDPFDKCVMNIGDHDHWKTSKRIITISDPQPPVKRRFTGGGSRKPTAASEPVTYEKNKNPDDVATHTYRGFQVTFRPFDQPYFETFERQQKAMKYIIAYIYNDLENKRPLLPIVRYDAAVEKRLNIKMYIERLWIHGHVYFTLYDIELTFEQIQTYFALYFAEFMLPFGDYRISVGSHDHTKRNYIYIYYIIFTWYLI